MSNIRFAILRKVRRGEEELALELDQESIRWRIAATTIVNLKNDKKPLRGFTEEQIRNAIEKAFDKVVAEFKAETVKL